MRARRLVCFCLLGGRSVRTERLEFKGTSPFAVIDSSGDMATTNPEERAEAAKMRAASGSSTADAMPTVDIEMGVQKYVLIRAGDRHLVRGAVRAAYHKDAARPCVDQLRANGVPYEVLGGGRINANPDDKSILVYGFSYGFPWPNGVTQHDLVATLLENDFPDWAISTSDEGY